MQSRIVVFDVDAWLILYVTQFHMHGVICMIVRQTSDDHTYYTVHVKLWVT